MRLSTKLPGLVALCTLCGLAAIAQAQDVVKVAGEHNKILMENDDVRVIQNTLAPGEKMRCTRIHMVGTTW